jgi:hypothetical protein
LTLPAIAGITAVVEIRVSGYKPRKLLLGSIVVNAKLFLSPCVGCSAIHTLALKLFSEIRLILLVSGISTGI